MIAGWVNGAAEALVTAEDRGLQYGDGLFETMAIREGRIRLLAAHLGRLLSGAERLKLGPIDRATLGDELDRAAQVPGAGVVKLIVTRAASGRGYRPGPAAAPNRIVSAYPPPAHPPAYAEQGVAVRLCRLRLAEQPALAGLKHLNRLEQVLARAEWETPEPQEGLMLDSAGCVVSGTMSNLFAVIDGELLTPALARCGVRGVMRAAVCEGLTRAGHVVHERDVSLEELDGASEVFLTNALIGAWPVRQLEGQRIPLGPVTRQAQALIAAL